MRCIRLTNVQHSKNCFAWERIERTCVIQTLITFYKFWYRKKLKRYCTAKVLLSMLWKFHSLVMTVAFSVLSPFQNSFCYAVQDMCIRQRQHNICVQRSQHNITHYTTTYIIIIIYRFIFLFTHTQLQAKSNTPTIIIIHIVHMLLLSITWLISFARWPRSLFELLITHTHFL